MVVYRCDGCGKEMSSRELRYTVSIDVRAAYDEIVVSLADLVQDHRAEILALIERMKREDVSEIEEQVYKKITLDLCPVCQRAYVRDPLHFGPGKGVGAPTDIDTFLRSLGFGGPGGKDG